MLNLNNYLGKELKIVQNSIWKSEFHLLDEQNVIGKLYSVKIWKNLYNCEFDNKTIEFYKKNIFGQEVFIKEKNKSLPFASFESNFFFTSGELKLDRGRKLLIKIGTFKNNASLYDSDKLLILINCKLSFKEKCIVTIENKSEFFENYPWLPFFIFYLTNTSKNTGVTFS